MSVEASPTPNAPALTPAPSDISPKVRRAENLVEPEKRTLWEYCARKAYRVMRVRLWRSPRAWLFARMLDGRPGQPEEVEFSNKAPFFIGGFPRSGNTFAAILLQFTVFPEGLEYHRHSPVYILKGARSSKPGILVLREPEATVVSWSIFIGTPVRRVLEDYLDFHGCLEPFWPMIYVAPFDWFTREPQELVRAASRMTGRECLKDLTPQLFTEVREAIEKKWTEPDGKVDEMKVARPSEERKELRLKLKKLVQTDKTARDLLQRANILHARLLIKSEQSGRLLSKLGPKHKA